MRRAQHQAVPQWLTLVFDRLARPGHDAQPFWTDRIQLQTALRVVDAEHFKRFPCQEVIPHDRLDKAASRKWDQVQVAAPSTLLTEALNALCVAHGQASLPPMGGLGLGAGVDHVALRLLDASSLARSRLGSEAGWPLPGLRGCLHTNVMVVADDGVPEVLQLQLSLVELAGACGALVPVPEQLLTPVTGWWASGLQQASAWWKAVLPGADSLLRNLAVAWSVVPGQRSTYGLLSGNSASAAMALGGLWLLAHDGGLLDRLPADWLEPLHSLRRSDLSSLFLTGAILADGGPEGELGLVGELPGKSGVLELARQLAPPCGPLHLHGPETGKAPPGLRTHPHLLHLARELCALDEPDTEDQQRLAQALRAALRASPADAAARRPPEAGPVQPPDCPFPQHPLPVLGAEAPALDACLRRLAADDAVPQPEVRHLAHYALHRWAAHGQQQGGQPLGGDGRVHLRFVNLQLESVGSAKQSFPTLENLLADPKVAELDALVVEGEPGAGKTWLLQRHEQALCEQIIAADGSAWLAPGGLGGQGLPVLPLYLSLRDLKPEDEPVAHVLAALQRRYPRERLGLQSLADPRAHRGWALRLLVDGLNEVPVAVEPGVDPAEARASRVCHVVLALKRAFLPKPGLTIVLGSRPGYGWDFADARQRLRVGKATVRRWSREQIGDYLERRWPEADKAEWRTAFMASLPEPAQGEASDAEPGTGLLLGLPLFLNLQCELWEAGARHLTAKRGHLLACMLWLRIHKALKADEGAREHLAADGMLCPDTEQAVARRFFSALQDRQAEHLHAPPVFPRRGLLLQGLFALAKRQWLHLAAQPSEVRGQVAVPVSLVDEVLHPLILSPEALAPLAQGLTPAQRRAECARRTRHWLAAVRALGLGTENKVAGTFAFSHQVFGEWLASQQLFYSGATRGRRPDEAPLPRHWAPAARARLRRELAPPALAHGAVAELALQRQRAGAAWQEVPQAVFDRWLERGIEVPEAEARGDIEEFRGRPGAAGGTYLDSLLGLKLLFQGQDREGAACWVWNMQAWGEFCKSSNLLPGLQGPGPWHTQRAAWALLCTGTAVPASFRGRAREEIAAALGGTPQAHRRAAQLWAQTGQLQLPPPGGLDDILPLAIDDLADPSDWWDWLCTVAEGQAPGKPPPEGAHWALLSRCLVELNPPVVGSLAGSGAGGPAGGPGRGANWWARSTHALMQVQLDHRGHDPRQRIQAGLMLGRQGGLGTPQGDHLRYERVAAGVRLRRHSHLGQPQWVPVQVPGEPRCELAAYAVTVGEFLAFLAHPGALDPAAPWWQAAGSAALEWLRNSGGQRWRPPAMADRRYNNPLQPITTVTAHAADAYARWADQVLYAGAPGFDDGLKLALPTARQHAAALHGAARHAAPGPAWPGHHSPGEPDPMLFNHVTTGWRLPAPVGCFGASTTEQGFADGAGNVWTWCQDVVETAGGRLRVLVGGSCFNPAAHCAAGVRGDNAPVNGSLDFGFRLARVASE